MIDPAIRPRFLIVNADDFGLTPSVSQGILECLSRGIVTSTSAMLATECGQDLLCRHAADLRGRAGIHLQLTGGTPLTAENTRFPANRRALGSLDPEEILREWHAQFDAFRAAGIEPTHIDTHHHVHKEPAAFAAYCRLARECALPARSCDAAMTQALRRAGVACPDGFECGWSGNEFTAASLLDYVEEAFAASDGGVVELMCHPGHGAGPSRSRELAALCDPELPVRFHEHGIQLANWSVLSRP